MINPSSLLSLKYIARKTLKKDLLQKILDLKDKDEQRLLFEYSIKSAIELKYAELKESVEKFDRKKGDPFIPLTKVYLLGSKIHYMNTTFHKKDFKVVMNLFNEVEKELKRMENVWTR
jgi:DNA-binding LytR/AlgR family response regulator